MMQRRGTQGWILLLLATLLLGVVVWVMMAVLVRHALGIVEIEVSLWEAWRIAVIVWLLTSAGPSASSVMRAGRR